jgi:DNA-binding transcriptional MerR regulator
MYTIKQAAARTGLSVELLRAWERRYGVPAPGRTGSGYRLYDERALALVRRMKVLVDEGWSPSQAAGAVANDTEAGDRPMPRPALGDQERAASPEGAAGGVAPGDGRLATLQLEFVRAAGELDESALESILSEAFVMLGPDEALERFVLPAVASVGRAWAAGELAVGAEHTASAVVMRRLAAMYDAAASGRPVGCLVGLPPGSRHEIGTLAFAVTCKRAGLGVLYLGADVPIESWVAASFEYPQAAVVLGAVTRLEGRSAAGVVAAVRASRPDCLVAVGGAARDVAAARRTDVLLLPDGLRDAARLLLERTGGAAQTNG